MFPATSVFATASPNVSKNVSVKSAFTVSVLAATLSLPFATSSAALSAV